MVVTVTAKGRMKCVILFFDFQDLVAKNEKFRIQLKLDALPILNKRITDQRTTKTRESRTCKEKEIL